MPKIGSKNRPEVNGQASPSSAKKRTKAPTDPIERIRGLDVEIGCQDYIAGEEDTTGSWQDLAKIVAGVRWLVPGWIPYAMLTGIIAEPKIGKSALALGALIKPVIVGGGWFNGLPGPDPGYAIWADTEGSGGINIERATKWQLPLDKIKTPFPDDPFKRVDLDNAQHIERLISVICKYKARLVVVDSFRGSHTGDENNSRIVRGLQNLSTIAERTKAAVVLIHHTKKMFKDEELTYNSGRGSNAFLAMVRVQLALDRPDEGSEWCRVRMMGENLGSTPKPFGFRIAGGGLEFGDAPSKVQKQTSKDEAEGWLRKRLQPGQTYVASEILEEAEQRGLNKRTVQKALTERLKVEPRPVRKDGKIAGWNWILPFASPSPKKKNLDAH